VLGDPVAFSQADGANSVRQLRTILLIELGSSKMDFKDVEKKLLPDPSLS